MAAGAVLKVGLGLKPNRHQEMLAQICETLCRLLNYLQSHTNKSSYSKFYSEFAGADDFASINKLK
jgi:hypothetical protein